MKLHIFDTPQETARALTHQLQKQLNTVRRTEFNLAISGGFSSELLFRLWAELYAKSIPWYRIHLYWVDERCVQPTDSDSNYGLAKRLFLDQVKIPRTQIHRIIGEANPVNEAERYSGLVRKNLPQSDGYPKFDFLILGIGTDGHIASIFPGQPQLLTSASPYASTIHPASDQHRITLTGEPILRSELTVFHVVGAEKAEILSRILNPDTQDGIYPAEYIYRNADHISFFIDAAAGKKLNTPS